MISLATVVAVGAVVAGATGAFYSDTETSEGNIFTAGSIDLQVDHLKQTYNGVDCETCSLTLASGSGDTDVVGGENTELNDFSFDAEIVSDPYDMFSGSAWTDDGRADWIWASSSTIPGDDGSNGSTTTYYFERTFQWNGAAGDINFNLGTAVDDEFEVSLNGQPLSIDTESGENNQSTVVENNFANVLQNGQNTLRFEVTNQVRDNTDLNNPDRNPGGLWYYLDIQREDCEEGVDGFQQQCQLWQEQNLSGDETFFNFGDIKPGDHGSNVISLHSYSNDAYSCLVANNGTSSESDVLEAEGDDNDNDGELQEYIDFFAWIDGEGNSSDSNGEYESGETPLGTSTLGNLESIASFDGENALTGTSTAYVGLKWCAGDISVSDSGDVSCDGSGMLNDAQSDSFESDLTAYAVQTRNNEDFSCEDIQPEDLQTGTENGTASGDES